MHLSDTRSLVGDKNLPNFWDVVSRIGVTLDLSETQLSDMLEVTPYRLRVMQRYGKEPTVSSAMALSKRLNIGFEDLVLDQFDYKLMAQQYFGNNSELPERYLSNALSRRRTVIPLLDYIEKYFGWAQRALILRRFQMTEAMFVDPDSTMNIRFGVELTDYLLDYYKNPNLLEHMGWFSARSSRSVTSNANLSGSMSVAEVYERAFADITPKHIEKNYLWRLVKLTDTGCIIEGRPSQEMLAMPEAQNLLKPASCLIRSGFLSFMPNYAKLGSSKVQKLSCVAHGDPTCTFLIQATEAQAV